MKQAALAHLRCPRCQLGILSIEPIETRGADVMAGRLTCDTCGSIYSIDQGVPRFVSPENYAGSFGLQWLAHRRTQLDSSTGVPISRTRFFSVTGWPADLRGERVLEAGSGAGRFTEVLASTGATIYTFDYSRAVEANFLNNGGAPNVHLFQADIFEIPVERASFDRVLCLGVLQHTPDPPRAFRALASCLRPGGELAIDVYTKSLSARLQWKYLLRPLTTRMDAAKLHRLVEKLVPPLVAPTAFLKRLGGRAGARLSPILEYSQLGLAPDTNRDWAVLDTFDMYAPAYDLPQDIATVRRWFSDAGLERIVVRYGPNGVVGRGRKVTLAT
ncbi:MAG TPA: class I SAM-dependent methyltransferase [Vicinamibacterales bacterium]|nr:class I SAM-dependent methyltransferase [Vicinamibacterales bacterium]